MQELFHLVRQLVGLHRADPVEDGLVARKIGVLVQQFGEVIVRQLVELQREEHQRRGVVCDFLLHVGHELGPARVGGLLVVAQAREGHDAPGDLIDFLVAQHAVEQTLGIQRGQIAFVIGGEAGAGFLQPVEVAFQFGRVLTGVEIAQIPFRQIAKVFAPGAGVGIVKREGKLKHRCTSFAFRHIYASGRAGTTYP